MIKIYRHLIILLFFSIFNFQSIAQNSITLWGNTNNIPNVSVKIYNTIYGTSADQNGNYSLKLKSLDSEISIQFSSIGFKDTIVVVNLSEALRDSIELKVKLKQISYGLAEVAINEDKEFLRLKGSKILDVEFQDDVIIILTAQLGKKVLYSVRTDGQICQKLDLTENYEEIYIDCFNSIFLISNRFALQITHNEKNLAIYAIQRFTVDDFNKKILPCKAHIGEYIVTSNFSKIEMKLVVDRYHNKRADYFYFHNDEGPAQRKLLSSFFDEDGYKISSSYYQEIIIIYFETTPKRDNLLELEVWDGNIWKLYNGNKELLKLITWYLQVESKEMKLYHFTTKDQLLFFDLANFNFLAFNSLLEQDKTTSLLNQKEDFMALETIIQDKETDILYGIAKKSTSYQFYKIDKQTGELLPLKFNLKVNMPISIEIHDGWVYYAIYDTFEKGSILDRKKIKH